MAPARWWCSSGAAIAQFRREAEAHPFASSCSARGAGAAGSRAYAAAHAAESDRIQAVLVLDNGTDASRPGAAGAGRARAAVGRICSRRWPRSAPPRAQGQQRAERTISRSSPTASPGSTSDQETRGYNHTHHSQVDTYDHAVPGDLMQASAVMAVTAVGLANLDVLLPRGTKAPVTPAEPMKPSAGLAAKVAGRRGEKCGGVEIRLDLDPSVIRAQRGIGSAIPRDAEPGFRSRLVASQPMHPDSSLRSE